MAPCARQAYFRLMNGTVPPDGISLSRLPYHFPTAFKLEIYKAVAREQQHRLRAKELARRLSFTNGTSEGNEAVVAQVTSKYVNLEAGNPVTVT